MQAFRLRDGHPGDVEQLVKLHYRVFDTNTHYLLLLGRPLLVSAYRWYCGSPNAFTVVAEESEGNAVGCATVNLGSYYAFFRKNWVHVAKAILSEPRIVLHPFVVHRLSALLRSRKTIRRRVISERCAYLGYLVVDAQNRGKGIGGALIRAAVESCRARGWEQLVTCLHRTNLSAGSLYGGLGFSRLPELDSDDLIGIQIRTFLGPNGSGAEEFRRKSAWLTSNGN